MGYKFRRQEVIGPYIVDFLCLKVKLIVEADGGQHIEQKAYDNERTTELEAKGYRVLRFWNNEILTELDAVLETIRLALLDNPSPQPSPKGRGS
jgi:very-short-patch-repair endonuclease